MYCVLEKDYLPLFLVVTSAQLQQKLLVVSGGITLRTKAELTELSNDPTHIQKKKK